MYADSTVSAKSLDQSGHRALAKEVALQGITLLRNEEGRLPLWDLQTVAGSRKQNIAVIGPLGDSVTAPGARLKEALNPGNSA